MQLQRASGVLLHPTSLPGPHGSGDLGREAYHWIDWLVAGAQTLWQILPLGGIGPGHSPYMSSSAFAGNVLLIDLHELQQQGWLDQADLEPAPGLHRERVNFGATVPYRMERLARAAARYAASATPEQREAQSRFEQRHRHWLDNYALFMALAEAHPGRDWCDWPVALAARAPAALAAAREQYAARIDFWRFCQCAFFRQWGALRAYANGKGIQIIGDVPIFIAHHSAEVWAEPTLFHLGPDGRPSAGRWR